MTTIDITLSAAQKSAIDFVISQEGGWKLAIVPGEYDWTYAGITAAVFDKYLPEDKSYNSQSAMQSWITEDTQRAHDTVYQIYAKEYLSKVDVRLDSKKILMNLSCIVNCGANGYKDILASCKYSQDNADFLCHWLAHYSHLVVANPSELKYLIGWNNRVLAFI